MKVAGACKWFNSTKGYGFVIANDSKEEFFVHQTNIYAKGFRSLKEGEELEFEIETDAQGRRKAVNVTGPQAGFVQGEDRPPRRDDYYGGGQGGGYGGRDDYGNGGSQYGDTGRRDYSNGGGAPRGGYGQQQGGGGYQQGGGGYGGGGYGGQSGYSGGNGGYQQGGGGYGGYEQGRQDYGGRGGNWEASRNDRY